MTNKKKFKKSQIVVSTVGGNVATSRSQFDLELRLLCRARLGFH